MSFCFFSSAFKVSLSQEFAEEERKRRKRAWNRTYNRRKAEKERIAKEKAALMATESENTTEKRV